MYANLSTSSITWKRFRCSGYTVFFGNYFKILTTFYLHFSQDFIYLHYFYFVRNFENHILKHYLFSPLWFFLATCAPTTWLLDRTADTTWLPFPPLSLWQLVHFRGLVSLHVLVEGAQFEKPVAAEVTLVPGDVKVDHVHVIVQSWRPLEGCFALVTAPFFVDAFLAIFVLEAYLFKK